MTSASELAATRTEPGVNLWIEQSLARLMLTSPGGAADPSLETVMTLAWQAEHFPYNRQAGRHAAFSAIVDRRYFVSDLYGALASVIVIV